MTHDELLTAHQVAVVLKVSPGYVYRLIRLRHLPAVRIGNSVRIRRRDLLWYLRERVPPSAAGELLKALGRAPEPEEEHERS